MNTIKKLVFVGLFILAASVKGYSYTVFTSSSMSAWVSSGTVFDIVGVQVSTGSNQYLVCIDTNAQAKNADISLPAISAYSIRDYAFPPIPLVPSSNTLTTAMYTPFSDSVYGGLTIDNGLVCYITGDNTTGIPIWSIRMAPSIMTGYRRR